MKLLRAIISIVFTFSIIANAATRGDVVVLEASEKLQLDAQEIANNYLLYYLYPHKVSLRDSFGIDLDMLGENIKKISINTKNPKAKGILGYFAVKKTEIADLLKQKTSKISAEEVVGISELFSEGAASIAKQHEYPFENEEKMLMLTKQMSTFIASTIKYYVAMVAIPNNKSYKKKMKLYMNNTQHGIVKLLSYRYSQNEREILENTNESIKTLQLFLDKAERSKVPMLVFLLGKKIEKSLNKLSIYHSQNQ